MRIPLGIFVLVAALMPVMAGAQLQPPPLTAPVNDFAGVVDGASAAELERVIRVLQATTGDVIVVATVTTAADWGDIRAYATRMFENHGRGIGQQGRDNGLLVLIAVDDREVWLEVGYDLEGFITDGFAGETSRQYMTPHFREGHYGAGLVAGVTRVAQRIAEGRQVTLDGVVAPAPDRSAPSHGPPPIGVLLVGGLILLNLLGGLGRRRRGGRRRWQSGAGPFAGGYMAGSLGRRGGSGGGFGGGFGGGGGGFSGGFGGFGGGRSGGGGGGARW
jgi:uncharacterized protein